LLGPVRLGQDPVDHAGVDQHQRGLQQVQREHGDLLEGLASIIVIWRFTGSRTRSETSERRAQKAVAISFYLLAPYIGVQSAWDLFTGHQAGASMLGIALTAASVLIMPALGIAKQRLGRHLDSGARRLRTSVPESHAKGDLHGAA
jgi:hypothetical protein